MPRTLVYCTAYAASALIWQRRYRRWVDATLASALGQSQILLVDDGSPVLPGWPDTDVVTLRSLDDVGEIRSSAPVLLIRLPNHLGRKAIYDFPGWYRSFACGAIYAATQGFTKIIHLESDAYAISERMRTWLRQTDTGWRVLWSFKYDFPELAIQVIGADQIETLSEFCRRPYAHLAGLTHETALPYTHIERGFTGDRLGEDESPIPAEADFATQVAAQRESSYYWWLNGEAGPAPTLPGRIEFGFTQQDASGIPFVRDGWSKPELNGIWMLHSLSLMQLPELPNVPAIDLVLSAGANARATQRLAIQVNHTVVDHFEFTSALRIGCEIPGHLLRRDGTDRLRFLHPDAGPPLNAQAADRRVLALMLIRMSLQPRPLRRC